MAKGVHKSDPSMLVLGASTPPVLFILCFCFFLFFCFFVFLFFCFFVFLFFCFFVFLFFCFFCFLFFVFLFFCFFVCFLMLTINVAMALGGVAWRARAWVSIGDAIIHNTLHIVSNWMERSEEEEGKMVEKRGEEKGRLTMFQSFENNRSAYPMDVEGSRNRRRAKRVHLQSD